MNHPDIRIHEVTAAAGQKGVQSSEPYVAINQDAQFRLSRASNKNYTGGPEPDPKATAEERAGKNDHTQWRSKICDEAFDRALKKQHLHKYGEEWIDDGDDRKVSHLTVDELLKVDEKYPVRYLRSASDDFLKKWIGGAPSIFKPDSNNVVRIELPDHLGSSTGGLLVNNRDSVFSNDGVGKFFENLPFN